MRTKKDCAACGTVEIPRTSVADPVRSPEQARPTRALLEAARACLRNAVCTRHSLRRVALATVGDLTLHSLGFL